MLHRGVKMGPSYSEFAGLTARERQVALLVAAGFTNKAIASELDLCVGTVKIHLHNIFQKLRISRRISLVQRGRAVG